MTKEVPPINIIQSTASGKAPHQHPAPKTAVLLGLFPGYWRGGGALCCQEMVLLFPGSGAGRLEATVSANRAICRRRLSACSCFGFANSIQSKLLPQLGPLCPATLCLAAALESTTAWGHGGGFKRHEATVPFGSSSQSLRELQLLNREHQNYWETETHTWWQHGSAPFLLHCITESGSPDASAQLMGFPGTTHQPCHPLHCSSSTEICIQPHVHCTETQLLHTRGCLPPGKGIMRH